ncbi:MAG: radical SAM protein [Planctomycetes bacterium]|nr:radical SAM protein [Planctomycetota bacterium]
MQRHSRPFNLKEFKIEVTYRCDLNCVHCSSDARPSNMLEMTHDDCLRILDDAAKMGAKDVALSGGEPLLWPHVFDVAEAASTLGLKVTIYTSGNVEDFRRKATRLHAFGVSCCIFSIFGAMAPGHERVTRKAGSFERTKAAMRDAVAVGLTTELHFVPMSGNYRELGDVAQIAHQFGASRVSVLRLVPQGRAALVRDRALSRVQNLELRRQILALRRQHGNDFVRTGSPYNFMMLNDGADCWAAIDRLIIGPDLRLFPCDAFKRIGASELVKTEDWSHLTGASLLDCWEKSPYLEAVRKYLTTDFEPPCDSCRLLEKCVSGCLAQKAIAYGSLDKKPDPDCFGPNFQGDAT